MTRLAHDADVIFKVGAIHSMSADREVYRSLALRDRRIVAVSADREGLDSLRSAGTRVVDDPGLTLLPAFFDTHEHLLEAARNLDHVAVDEARSLDQLIELIRSRALQTPPGQWIQTSSGWHEAQLVEARMPTVAELDHATSAHPVLCLRGRQVCAANSMALRLAGVSGHAPTAGASVLEGAAARAIKHLVPRPTHTAEVARLGRGCRAYSALGVAAIREAMLESGQLEIYQRAWEVGVLTIRCRVLLFVDSTWPLDERLAFIEAQQVRSGFGDEWLRLCGLKFVLDGHIGGAALEEPYADDASDRGQLRWHPEQLVEVLEFAIGRGWKVATHAMGDRAVRTVLDAYGRVAQRHRGLAPGTLTIEHAMLASPDQRARAARLGVAITVQHPLMYTHGTAMIRRWGAERAAAAVPIRSWLAEGVLVGAGSDMGRPVNPLLGVWSMVTRETRDMGVLGTDEAIDRHTAVELLTREAARLTGELDRRGRLQPGRLADLVAYRADPLSCPIDDLPELEPALTVVGGKPTHDPDDLLGG